MPVKAVWDNEAQTIIRQDFTDEWTWDGHRAAVEATHAMMESVEYPVDVIANLVRSRVWPTDPLSYTRRAMEQAPPNAGLTVVVVEGGSLLFVETLLSIFRRIDGRRGSNLAVAHTVNEARNLIASRRDVPRNKTTS